MSRRNQHARPSGLAELVHAAEAAEAAHAQAHFWEMHALLFKHQLHLYLENLRHYAAELQLDMQGFEKELEQGVHVAKVQADMSSGLRSHIKGTPAFFVNGVVVDTSFGRRLYT